MKQAVLCPGCITVALHELQEEPHDADEVNLDNVRLRDFYPSSHLPAIKQGGILVWWLAGGPIPGLQSAFLWPFWFQGAFYWPIAPLPMLSRCIAG